MNFGYIVEHKKVLDLYSFSCLFRGLEDRTPSKLRDKHEKKYG